jgi:hypothetical protein
MKNRIVSDMAFAAYLVFRGARISAVHRTGRKVSWEFEISEQDYLVLESEWPSSPSCQFFNTYAVLKTHLRG